MINCHSQMFSPYTKLADGHISNLPNISIMEDLSELFHCFEDKYNLPVLNHVIEFETAMILMMISHLYKWMKSVS